MKWKCYGLLFWSYFINNWKTSVKFIIIIILILLIIWKVSFFQYYCRISFLKLSNYTQWAERIHIISEYNIFNIFSICVESLENILSSMLKKFNLCYFSIKCVFYMDFFTIIKAFQIILPFCSTTMKQVKALAL